MTDPLGQLQGQTINPNDPRVIVVNQPTPPPPPANEPPTFTMEEVIARVEAARVEEKEKLYGTLNTMDERLKVFEAEKQALTDEAATAQAAADEAARVAAQQEMTVAERLTLKEQEWEQRFQQQQAAMEADRATFVKEREFQQIAGYRATRLAELSDQIDPRFHDFVGGTTPEEIEASLYIAAQKTQEIGQEFQQYLQGSQQVQQQQQVAPRAGLPVASGPGFTPEQMWSAVSEGQETLTAEQIAAMPMSEFAAKREALLGAASRQVADHGLYGSR